MFPTIRTRSPSLSTPLLACGFVVALFAAMLPGSPAAAQGKLDARYEVTLAGIPIGIGSWVIEMSDDQYSASASGGTTGLLKAFAGGTGSGTSQGRIVAGALVPAAYTATMTSSRKSETVRIALADGNVKDSVIEPTPPAEANRIPVTDAQKQGVQDPMTASLLRVSGTADLLNPQSCHTAAAVFDGRMRYDLHLEYKRTEMVKAEKGYRGPALVCSLYFVPISGYIPDRIAIKYLSAQRNMEIWLVPIAGTRVLVPFRMTIPTPLGLGKLEATQFLTTATPPRPPVKTQ